MHIPVVLEPVAGNGFRARSGEPFPGSAEGATGEEAIRRLRELIERRLAAGAQVIQLEIQPATPESSLPQIFDRDDPLVEEWKQAMAENRRREDPDLP